jgi:hypothetical protein
VLAGHIRRRWTAFFEYDLPSSLFGQFGDSEVTQVGRELDTELQALLRSVAR